MTIDENQTPHVNTEPEPLQASVTEASDPTPVAETTEAPLNDEAEAPTPPAETAEPEAPTEPSAPTEPEPLPASDPQEPVQPVEPADPVPAPPAPEPVTPADPTPAPQPPVQPQGESDSGRVQTTNDSDLFDSYMSGDFTVEGDAPEGGFKRLTRGERLEATVVHVEKDRLFVDLGTKSEGIVPLGELSEENLETAKGHFNVGDKINVVVIRPEGAEGNPIVSKKRADFEEAWDRIEDAFKTGEMITAQVVDRVKGGLVVDVGVRGFVPATHVGSGKLRNIEKFVGNPLQLKVIEIDRDRKKVVLSNREAEELRRQEAKEAIFEGVKPGEVLEGTVRRLTDYGAFVDLGGVDGLLHISEMSWARINHPKEMFKEGQKIKVMVLRLDPGAGKISLGHRQVLPDPWKIIGETYTTGQKLNVSISRIVQSGAFIRLPEGAEAFMPVSEMSFRRIKRPQDVVEEGQEVEAQIIDLRPDERRMVLSMRALGGGADARGGGRDYAPAPGGGGGYEDEFRRDRAGAKGKKGAKKGGRGRDDFEDIDDFPRRGVATGGATIGERLGMLKGFLSREDEDEEETKPQEETTEEE
ncbi:MAG TPA: S1 RNA-binding domain-containing protein [Fimbriimonas sp.]